MDKLKDKINEIVKKIKEDKDFANNFKKDPVKAVENVIGIDLPDDQINKVVDAVKAKISVDNVKGATEKLKGLFK